MFQGQGSAVRNPDADPPAGTVGAVTGRDFIYPLRQTSNWLYRYMLTTEKGSAEGAACVRAMQAIDRAESAARRFPMDVTGL